METIDMVVIFVADNEIQQYDSVEVHGRTFGPGDFINLNRSDPDSDHDKELAVVLGTGLTKVEAREKGTLYYRRLLKWDGVEEPSVCIEMDSQEQEQFNSSMDVAAESQNSEEKYEPEADMTQGCAGMLRSVEDQIDSQDIFEENKCLDESLNQVVRDGCEARFADPESSSSDFSDTDVE